MAPQAGLPGGVHAFQVGTAAHEHSMCRCQASLHVSQPPSCPQSAVAPAPLQPIGQVYPTQPVPYMGESLPSLISLTIVSGLKAESLLRLTRFLQAPAT